MAFPLEMNSINLDLLGQMVKIGRKMANGQLLFQALLCNYGNIVHCTHLPIIKQSYTKLIAVRMRHTINNKQVKVNVRMRDDLFLLAQISIY